ncbi:MAG: 4Fe-4S dicluster domain-containing protein [Deltaproteobacteria bacterium]|nr:4Fe-4S dicluster domain-containing protein [Deltaproteobacteria bacterium]
MDSIETKLREEAARLLTEGKADVVVGYEAGTLPLTVAPSFATTPEEAGRLVWNAACGQNLAKYVHDLLAAHRESQKRVKPEDRRKKVVGVVAPGCATRSVAIHLNEKQYARDEVVVLGVPCEGVIDRRKLLAAAGGEELLEGSLNGDSVRVATAAGAREVLLQDVLAASCVTCRMNNPVLVDVMLGPEAPARQAEREYDEVDAFETLPAEERWAFFEKEMAKCMRCYACRNACPSCYCRQCFLEQSQPQWIGIGEDRSDVQNFQLMRMYHMAGRCVDCGSCSAVCPMGVDLHKFLKKLDKDAFTMFGHRAGASADEPAPLSTAREDDPEEFIFNP